MLLIAGLIFYFTGNTKVGGILLGIWGALTVIGIIGSLVTGISAAALL